MKFTKMQGAGNDFIILNNLEEKLTGDCFGDIAKELCSRRISIGADGLMVIESPEADGDFRMLFYNADGSQGEMCGNGARCICCYGYEKGLAGEVQRVETTAGVIVGQRISKRKYRIRLNDISIWKKNFDVMIEGKSYSVGYVELGNPGLPHGIVEIKDLKNMNREDLREIGKNLRHLDMFPKGINVNFYEIIGNDEICELTYERGVEDFTLACGTGTGSVVAVLTSKGLVSGKNVKVNVPGGVLYVDIENVGNPMENIYLTGPVKIVAEGYICD